MRYLLLCAPYYTHHPVVVYHVSHYVILVLYATSRPTHALLYHVIIILSYNSLRTLTTYTRYVRSLRTLATYTRYVHSLRTLATYTRYIHSLRTLATYAHYVRSLRTLTTYTYMLAMLL